LFLFKQNSKIHILFFRKKNYSEGISPGRIALSRFMKNKMAVFFFALIILAVIMALLGYLITPDSSPYANEQNLELAAQKPGFSTQILLVAKNEEIAEPFFIKRMLFGSKNKYDIIPFNTYYIKEDNIIITQGDADDTLNYIQKLIPLADVAFSLLDTAQVVLENNTVRYYDAGNKRCEISLDFLQNIVIKEHIKTKKFWLGTDRFGRDVLSQIIIGTRVSLSVGLISVLISLIIGVFLGAVAGYYKGWVDNVIVWFINVVWSVPTLLLVIAITFVLGKGFWQVFIAVGLTMWVEVARVVRGQFLSLREKEFVEASRALGYKNFRIIFKHILPNAISPVIVISAANFASAILIESGLSFLGIGVQPPMPSWGTMIKEHYSYIILDKAYLAILPGAAIMLMVMAFMIVGNALRDALDVKVVFEK